MRDGSQSFHNRSYSDEAKRFIVLSRL
jgi:hypothetical protein